MNIHKSIEVGRAAMKLSLSAIRAIPTSLIESHEVLDHRLRHISTRFAQQQAENLDRQEHTQ